MAHTHTISQPYSLLKLLPPETPVPAGGPEVNPGSFISSHFWAPNATNRGVQALVPQHKAIQGSSAGHSDSS